MSTQMRVHTSQFGQMTITRPENPADYWPNVSSGYDVEVNCWRPPPCLREEVPHNLELRMASCKPDDGSRFFRPTAGSEHLITMARVGGLAILSQIGAISAEQLTSYRVSFLVFDWLRSRSLRLQRKFATPLDLVLRKNSRHGENIRDVLPESIGLNSLGAGRRWSVDRLLKEGAATAQAAGEARPSNQTAIAHGLMAAALRNPLQVTPNNLPAVLRMALYAVPDGAAPSTEQCHDVFLRCYRAFWPHLAEPQKKFDAWLRGGNSNIEKTLASLAGFPKMDRGIVRRTLFELGWQAHFVIASCLKVQFTWFLNSFEGSLTNVETESFRRLYLPQAEFGGLPLLLLMDRRTLITPFLAKRWNEPTNPEVIGAFHQVLAWYSEMVGKRRIADRLTKKEPKRAAHTGEKRSRQLVNEDRDKANASERTLEQLLAEELVKAVGQLPLNQCEICSGRMDVTVVDDAFEPGRAVAFRGRCRSHPTLDQRFDVEWEIIERLGRAIGEGHSGEAEE